MYKNKSDQAMAGFAPPNKKPIFEVTYRLRINEKVILQRYSTVG